MGGLTEIDVERVALGWLQEMGYQLVFGPYLAPNDPGAERASFADCILHARLKAAVKRLNPTLPKEALEEAFRKVAVPQHPSLIANNRAFHRMLVDGITVECQRKDGSIGAEIVRLIDFDDSEANDWLAVNQFTVIEGQQFSPPAWGWSGIQALEPNDESVLPTCVGWSDCSCCHFVRRFVLPTRVGMVRPRFSLMPATAAWPTAAGIEIAGFGNAAQLEGLADVLADRFLNFVHRLLRVEKTASDRIAQQMLALLLEFGDLRFGKTDSLSLLVLKVFALLIQRPVLFLGFFVGEECFHVLAHRQVLLLMKDGLAEFTSLFQDHAVLSRLHS